MFYRARFFTAKDGKDDFCPFYFFIGLVVTNVYPQKALLANTFFNEKERMFL